MKKYDELNERSLTRILTADEEESLYALQAEIDGRDYALLPPDDSSLESIESEAWTTAPVAGQPRDFRSAAQRLPNGTVNLTWNSVAGRGYRVEASTNGTAGSPISNWIQATTATTTYPIPSLNPNSRLFRVQVQP